MVVKYCFLKSGSCSKFKDLDIFGANVEFTFKGKRNFTTIVGALITSLMFAVFLSFMTVRTLKLFSKDDPFLSTMTMDAEDKAINLWDLGFYFAIEQIDPRVGYIEVW